MADPPGRAAAYDFIFRNIDSVPHLEALLLVWNSRPSVWTEADLAKRLYVSEEAGRQILGDLARQKLISIQGNQYWYEPASEEADLLLRWVYETYRREMVGVSTMIHQKASRAVRDFAQAFRFKKEGG